MTRLVPGVDRREATEEPSTRPLGASPARGRLRRSIPALGAAALVGAIAWAGWSVAVERRFALGMAEARRLMDADRFADARLLLKSLPSAHANDPELNYRLGTCAHAAGDLSSALSAWERVAPGSAWGLPAGLARARTLVGDLGRFSDAEAILRGMLSRGGPDDVRHTLDELLFWEGRRDEVAGLIERGFATAADPALELRDHWRAETSPTLIEAVREEVERSALAAPDDDRVWLSRASLASQSGRLDEAEEWLRRCTDRRPDDPAAWRARLERGRAAGDLDEVRAALRHLPVDALDEPRRLALRAWLAAKLGDRGAERSALERLVAIEPGRTEALGRLAELAFAEGRADLGREYRARKARADADKDRYRALLDATIGPAQFAELGRLAESLGRRFEARGWWRLRSRSEPSDREALAAADRLREAAAPAPGPSGATLASTLIDLDPALASTAASPSPAPSGPAPARAPRFQDRARAAGLDFVFENGRTPERQIPETTSGGVGLLDFDRDGHLDVFLIQGGSFPPRGAGSADAGGDRLFRNRGDGTFEDASARSGIARLSKGYGHGVAVGDFDNDGDPDLFLTRWRSYALYRNRGDGTFEEITVAAGLGGDRDWPTSAAFADLDNDGDLDLYVCHYLKWDAEHPTLCPRTTTAAPERLSDPGQRYNYCTPRPFPALADHLFRNDGGRFVDVTAEAGIVDRDGRGLGVVAADVDDDGRVDLFVANDTTANYLWHSLGGMRFEEIGAVAGVACNASGAFQAGMGTALGDLDGDGLPDLFVTNFYGESTSFFRNLGSGTFSDQTGPAGLAGPTRFLLGFGIATLDADNDGRLDLAIANGHVNDDRPDYPYAMPASLLAGGEGGRLKDVSAGAGPSWNVPRVARGLAVGDLDDDGRVDVLMVAQKDPLAYLHNETPGGHFATFALEGTRSNRDAVGAVVTISAGGRRQRAWRYGGGSFQSSSDPRLHFGVEGDRIDEVEVKWPSGRVDRHRGLAADRAYRLREGEADPRPSAGQAGR